MPATNKKIVVVDDNPAILDAIRIMLEEDGYIVETTQDGATVTVQNTSGSLPDLFLIDIWMSGMDGREICKFLKGSEASKRIPIIMVSATKDVERISKDAGADDYISKPFQMEEMLALVAKYVNKI